MIILNPATRKGLPYTAQLNDIASKGIMVKNVADIHRNILSN